MRSKKHMLSLLAVFALPIGVATTELMAKANPSQGTDPNLKKRQKMIVLSRQLGVTCAYCHKLDNFLDESMKMWKISKEHMRIVDWLNSRGFRGKPKADCYMCHRGKTIPNYIEPPPSSLFKKETASKVSLTVDQPKATKSN